MRRRRCVNCQVPARFLCIECARMVVATIVGELAVAVVLWALRS